MIHPLDATPMQSEEAMTPKCPDCKRDQDDCVCVDPQERIKELEAQLAERDRSVIKANEQAERFEREWYLRGDELDEAQKLLLLAKGALESANECIGLYSHPGSKLVMEALAAIDDSKLVEGLILCDAEPFCTYYDIDGTIGICRPDIEVPHGAEVPLYAPRRTEK